MNLVKTIQTNLWMRWMYLLFFIPPVLISLLVIVGHFYFYLQIQQGIESLTSSQSREDQGLQGILESSGAPSLLRLEHISYIHLGMTGVQAISLLFIICWIASVIHQNKRFCRPREIMTKAWAAAIIPAVTISLITRFVIEHSVVDWNIGLSIGILVLEVAGIARLPRKKNRDDEEANEVYPM